MREEDNEKKTRPIWQDKQTKFTKPHFKKTWKSSKNCMDYQTFVQTSITMYIVYFSNKFGVFEWLCLNQ